MLKIGDRVSLKNAPGLTGIVYGAAVNIGAGAYVCDVAWDFSISTSHPQEGLEATIFVTLLKYIGPSTEEERLTHRHEKVRELGEI